MKPLLSLLILLVAPIAAASEFAGYDILIPVAGRTPGALGSSWRTDLYVTNADRHAAAEPISIIFDGAIIQANIAPRSTITVKDVIGRGFGRDQAVGSIRIVSQSPSAKITARARIYNIGSAQGEYGQTVQGLPVSKLSRETYLPGLSGLGGNRSNVGIANPSSTETAVFLSIFDEYGEFRGGFSTVVAPRSLRLFNDVFSHFQTGPLDSATIQITSASGVYAYASVVRSDTGDGDFIAGTGVQIDDSNAVVQPACANPAALLLAPIPSDGWLVLFKPGYEAHATTADLAARHAFTPKTIFAHAMQAFHAELTPAVVAALRCESSVRVVEQNAQVPLP